MCSNPMLDHHVLLKMIISTHPTFRSSFFSWQIITGPKMLIHLILSGGFKGGVGYSTWLLADSGAAPCITFIIPLIPTILVG